MLGRVRFPFSVDCHLKLFLTDLVVVSLSVQKVMEKAKKYQMIVFSQVAVERGMLSQEDQLIEI